VKNDKSDFVHDRYFRFAFAEPKRMAELLTLFSRHNATLKAFLDTIDLASLRGAKENFSSDKHVGSADLVFEVEFLDVGHAIDDVELKDFSPITLVALTAMKYIGAKAQYMAPRSYRQVHLPLRLSA
jgi:hypothetical protein